MNCPSYQELIPPEKYTFIGELIHAAQNDETFFKTVESMLRNARNNGLLDGVEILPKPIQTDII